MSKFTFNFTIAPGTEVEYELTLPPFQATLRETTLALTTTADDANEGKVREQADQVAHNLALSLSYEHSQRYDVVYQGSHVLLPTGKTRLSASIQITVKPRISVSDSGEFEVRDTAGNVTDSSALRRERERHAAQQRLGERAIRADDPNLRDMLDHWARYTADPHGRLHPLYDVLQVAERLYGGRKPAASALGVSRADLDDLGHITNDPTILHGRHLGESQGPHRIVTESEVNTCVRVARALIDAYAAKIAVPGLGFTSRRGA